ncbi:MAG: thiamine phosphate synthase [Methylotenera sp.]|nr:MAG: thiamine phosphate synthase [Methylotenera sp.]
MLIQGLYAVTPDIENTDLLLEKVTLALQGGANILQYRNKLADAGLRKDQASALLPVCRQYHVPLIINDDVALCQSLDADGVHLGGTDGDIAAVRQLLDAHKIIGTSCYNRLDLAQQAATQGASYIAFGACFASSTKPHAPVAPLDLFAQAKPLGLPMVAIGGITLETAQLAIQAGADAVAVINALFANDDVIASAAKFNQLFETLTIKIL